MALHPQAEGILKEMEAQGLPPFEEMSIPMARAVAAGYVEMQGEPEEVAQVHDVLADGPAGQLPVRVYVPEGEGPLPLLVYFHGGGWVIGNVEVVDRPCRALANATGCVVASVEYRLSPETKFPGPVEDCYSATSWLAEHAGEIGADPGRVAVSGDSAGGNLAAAVALMARDRGGPRLAYQLLIYPVIAPAEDTAFESYSDNADGYLLTRGGMEAFWRHYLSDPADGRNPYASPLYAEDLGGLPPATVVTCGFDPLRDEGRAYAEKLQQAGVAVEAVAYDDMIHGFFWMGGVIDHAREMLSTVGEHLRRELAST